jgi:hypothetical protein
MAHGLAELLPAWCWDDHDWLDVFDHCIKGSAEELVTSLGGAFVPAIIRTYHGCRTEDAGRRIDPLRASARASGFVQKRRILFTARAFR